MELVSFIGASVVVFTAVILALVAMLTVAKKQLIPEGQVQILINGDPDRSPKVQPGSSLLSSLANEKIFIPSACGGGGTCAMCKCQVIAGGGDVLPTELGQLTMRERKDHWRLACQVKVKQDMKIKIPEAVFGVKKFEATVISNDNVATFIKEFVVRLPEGVHLDFESGGYIQIDVPKYTANFSDFDIPEKYRGDWNHFKFFDLKAKNDEDGVYRAYSMANHPAEGNIVMLNIRIATPPPKQMDLPPGLCSSYIFSLKPGDKITLSGPYGEFHIQDTDREMIYVGGGAGMAPLRSHLFHLFHTLKSNRKVSYWYGARSMREIFYEDQFRAIEREFPNFKFHIALSDPQPEDNWSGYVGFIHNVVIDNYLSKHDAPEDCEYYFCGPPMMLKAVQKMCDDFGVPAENVRYDDFG